MGPGVSAKSYSKPPSWLRALDVQDLCLLSMAFHDIRCCDIAKLLHLSFPAVSQRVKKISSLVGFAVFSKEQGILKLTEEGRALAEAVDIGLKSMYDTGKEEKLLENNECGFLGPGDLT